MQTKQYKTRAVVIGTGAGGAVAAATLAEAGVETIILERGKFYKKEDHASVFTGLTRMYLNAGATIAFGRPPISITLGDCVGGTTTINSSTCFRPPEDKVRAWGGPPWDELLPFIERVERRINAVEADLDLLGGNYRVLKRGCDALGVEIRPLKHNIRNCKKRGRCQFGCPEGAKQSTDVTFIPDALDAGATLLTEHEIDRIIIENGRAAGVAGNSPDGPFEVKAEHVVLALGAMGTPVLLRRNRLANSSRMVGKGLHIHPATRMVAEMDEIVDGHVALPQGAYIDKWHDRGIMLEGIFLNPGLMLASLPGVGNELKQLAADYRRLSAFGVMVTDTSTGTVRPGAFGSPFFITYQLNRADAENIRFGIARLAEIYLAAGARRIFTGFHRVPVVAGKDDLARLEAAPVKPNDLETMAFHPLGTCRMGAAPASSVVNLDLETHNIKNLYIMDGSVVPGPLGVNPQITIMSLTARAATLLAGRIKGIAPGHMLSLE